MRSSVAIWLGIGGVAALLGWLLLGTPLGGDDASGGRGSSGFSDSSDSPESPESPGRSQRPASDSRRDVARRQAPPLHAEPDRTGERTDAAAGAAPDERPSTVSEEERLDVAFLSESGLRDNDVAWLRENFEKAERERDAIRDVADSEGRPLSLEERLLLRDIDAKLVAEVGEENYDKLLYAAGDYNRVLVRGVGLGSPAEAAGLQPGDFIVRWDGVPVFRYGHARELLYGTPNETTVPIEVQRGEEILEMDFDSGSTRRPTNQRGRIFGLSVTRDKAKP